MQFLRLVLMATFALSFLALAQQLKSAAAPEILYGESPQLLVTGLKPLEIVTLHSYRQARFYKLGSYEPTPVVAHAYAEFQADATGSIDVDHTAPLKGTYSGIDPLGLLWSGEKMDTKDLDLPSPRTVLIRLERAQKLALTLTLQLTNGEDRVSVQIVSNKDLNGVFARPKNNDKRLPAIILLHGSNGGNIADARAESIRFAQLGYAAFALNYFAWTDLGSVPHALVNIPVESITAARTWLAQQANVETEQVALWGVSKGAEYALVAAANLSWINRVVACVPSSVVWSGFGRAPLPDEVYSSWSVQGRSLPFIPYDDYSDVLQGRLSAAAVHRRSLEKASPKDRATARIPVENSDARFLLLGATRDHVWPSATMTHELETTLRTANKSDHVTALIFEDASHFICGTGEETQRINPILNPEGNNPLPDATARAAAASWAATKRFLQ